MRTPVTLSAFPLLFVACTLEPNAETGAGAGGTAGTNAGSTNGGTSNIAGTSSGKGGSSSGSAGTASGAPNTGGSATGGHAGSTAGTRNGEGGAAGTTGGSASGTTGTSGNAGMAGGAGGADGTGGSPNAGAGGTSAGSGGSVAGGSGGGSTECTRELLKSTLDAYFVALAAHDPSGLPLADNVKFTENGQELELGGKGLWMNAGAVKHTHSALDTELCTSMSQAVVPDGNTDIPLGVRLKLEAQKITEIETIAVRAGDYSLASNTNALTSSAESVHWEDPVAADERNTREEIAGWMNKYFRMFPRGVCDTASTCRRIENGGGSFGCSDGASCAAGEPGPNDNALTPRLILVDIETGLGVGFTYFQNTYADSHLFKMYGGKVYGVSALLAEANSSGWD